MRPASIADLPERVRCDTVARMTGLAERTVAMMAQRGEIPGAAKLGVGRACPWTFDPAKVRAWIADRERAACPSIAEARHGGGDARLPAASIAEAYERAIGLKPGAGSRRGGRNSKAPASA